MFKIKECENFIFAKNSRNHYYSIIKFSDPVRPALRKQQSARHLFKMDSCFRRNDRKNLIIEYQQIEKFPDCALCGKETRLFFPDEVPPESEKAGFLSRPQKKRCIKNFCSGT
ncbi:Uncharacterized protein dnm_099640 [Desulfonema magnum]|uniref:Uncharacterized protein n=1 Tax=Desulfonema magnum TaxID=45655 RepID=A0A975BY10_9BACT|nr:Uncharacterized protein dnm_099640 [Desulfonema magnum]